MESGLSSHEAQVRLSRCGPNTITALRLVSPLRLFLAQFPTFINGILLVAGIFSLLISDLLDGVFILAVIFLNAVFSFIQEYRAERSLEKLNDYVIATSRVIRDGSQREIPSKDIVPGDLVILSEGERIPADGTVSKARRLEVDESILTGESLPVVKETGQELFSGTLITKGRGELLVKQTGQATKLGQIASTLSHLKTDPTPLQRQLTFLGRILSVGVMLIALLIIPIGIYQRNQLIPIIFTAVSIGIAAIPESLPAVITISLAIGTSRMAKRRAIARKMPAIETLGAIQILLVDKTGTLTQNSMQVKKVWQRQDGNHESLLLACALGNTASLVTTGEPHSYDIVGDRTDGALLLWATQQDPQLGEKLQSGKVIDEFVFDSEAKTITTIWEQAGKRFVYVRGAPEILLQKSTLSEKEKAAVATHVTALAAEGLRVIGVAVKQETRHEQLSRAQAEMQLQFIGLLGLYDPPREGVREALLSAKHAGIQTIMVTGDNPITARSIAQEIGLLTKGEDVLTSEELHTLTDDELLQVLPKTRVFARSTPEDKLRLTTLLKQQGYVVGVTGDGVNDALALKKADVGVAMGASGTEVAKEASDIVLTDDHFATLLQAIEEGRTIYANILKAILYLLTSNLSEISLVFLATLLGLPSPLLPTQILWINIVTDGIPALAIASDPTSSSVLRQKPRNPKESLLTPGRIVFIITTGLNIALGLIILFDFSLMHFSEIQARTLVFNTLIVCHLTLAFLVRGHSLLRFNKLLVAGTIITLLLQYLITMTPALQAIFKLAV